MSVAVSLGLDASCPNGWGSADGYSNHGCRCDVCIAAHREQARAYRMRKRGVTDGPTLRQTWLPFAPLESYVMYVLGPAQDRDRDDATTAGFTIRNAARLCGIDPKQWHRWKRSGVVRADSADRVAIALGEHPSSIWGEAWWVSG